MNSSDIPVDGFGSLIWATWGETAFEISNVHEQILSADQEYPPEFSNWIRSILDDYALLMVNANMVGEAFIGIEDIDRSERELLRRVCQVTGSTSHAIQKYLHGTLGPFARHKFGSLHGTVVLGDRALHLLGYNYQPDQGGCFLETHRQIPIADIENIEVQSLIRFDGMVLLLYSLLNNPKYLFGSRMGTQVASGNMAKLFKNAIVQELKQQWDATAPFVDPFSGERLPNADIEIVNVYSKGLSDYLSPRAPQSPMTSTDVIALLNQGLAFLNSLNKLEFGPIFYQGREEAPQLFSRSLGVTVTDGRNGHKLRFECVTSQAEDFISELIEDVTSRTDTAEQNPEEKLVEDNSAQDLVSQISKLAELNKLGILSDEEFTIAKKRVLGT